MLGEVVRSTSAIQAGSKASPVLKNVPAGHKVVLAAQAPSTTASTSWVATDTKGNTWVKRPQQAYTTSINSQIVVFDCVLTTPLTTSDSITVTSTDRTPAGWAVLAFEFDNLSAFNTQQTNLGASTAPSTGTTPAPSQDSQLVFCAFGFVDTGSANVFTKTTGFTDAPKATAPLATPKSLACQWRYVNVAAPSGRSAIAGLAPSANWVAAIVLENVVTESGIWLLQTGPVKVPLEITYL